MVVLIVALGLSGALQAQVSSMDDTPREMFPVRVPVVIDDDEDDTQGFGFGKKIAGTWLGSLEIPNILPLTMLIQTYNVDGTAQTSSDNAMSSIHHVEWDRSGLREIEWRVLHFSFDDTGAVTSISRTWGVQEYDADFEEFAGEFYVEVCLPHPEMGFAALLADPNDPNACFMPPIPAGVIQGKRLHTNIP